jgi:DNA-binding CsgD family transcriptional regulator
MTRRNSAIDSHAWTGALAALLESAALERVWDYVLDVLHRSFNVSSLSVVTYAGDTMPAATFFRAMDDPEGLRIRAYLQGAYLLDPFFHAVQNARISGCYALSQVAPDGFKDGQYYKTFFARYGLEDEVDLLFPLDAGQTVALAFGRSLGSRRFGAGALAFLSGASEFFSKLAERSVMDGSKKMTDLDGGVRALFHTKLKAALENAGRSLLSPREKNVLDYSLRGFSAKATAKHLNVSAGTVRLHRHNIYAKLEVTSQSELFALVLKALTDANSETVEDPLALLIASRR